jgi:hypothetical protein
MRLPEKEQPTGFACEWRKTLPAMLGSVRDHEHTTNATESALEVSDIAFQGPSRQYLWLLWPC